MIAKNVRRSTKSALVSVSALSHLGSDSRAWVAILICAMLAVVCAASAPLSAQTAYFTGTVASPLPSISSDGPAGVAIDATGNIFFADYFTSCAPSCKVFEIPYSGGTYGTPTAIGTFNQPIGVAVNASDDVFVADYTAGEVYEMTPNGSGGWNTPTEIDSTSFDAPIGVALDAAGDLFVTDYAEVGTSHAYEITFSGGVPSAAKTIGAAFLHAAGVAVDSAGNVYVADNATSAVYVITPGSSTNTAIGSGFTNPDSVAVDASGNVYVTEHSVPTLKEIVASNGKAAGSTTILTLNFSGIANPYGVAVDGNGNLYVSDSNSSSYAIKEIMLGSVNFGSAAVATSSPLSETLQFDVTVGGTMSGPAVLTNGAASSDFSLSSTTCSGSVSAGTCTVTVHFTPKDSGTRTGAVELLNSGGTAIVATAHVNGTGTGPQITFGPGVPAKLAKSTTFTDPDGVAVDGSGNVYVADSGAPAVYQIPPASATATALGSGFDAPKGVAVDGNGDVFVADPSSPAVKEILAVNGSIPATPAIVSLGGFIEGGTSFSFSAPSGTAVDSAGNVYVADATANAVEEILAASGYSVVTTLNSSSFSAPKGVAVDSSGNVYVADTGHNAVKEIVAVNGHVTSSSTVSTLGGGFSFHSPQSVTVDGNGNVFISDNDGVYEIPFGTSTVNTLVSGLSTSSGVAVDATGNVYYSNTGAAQVLELPLATAPTLTFALQGDGTTSAAQSVTILNDGNGATPLDAVSPGIVLSSSNYTLGDSSGDCGTTFSLSPGQSCNVSVEFTPVAPASGTVTGTVTLTDNDLNASPSTTQQISLTGTAEDITITAPATLPAATYGSSYSEGPFTASPSSTYTWSATGLPTGLSMSSGGTLSGTPTEVGTFSSVVVTATDTISGFSGSMTYTLTVDQATPVLTVTNSPVTYNGSAQAAVLTATVTGIGTVPGLFSSVQYSGSGTVPTSAGTYAMTATFTPTDTTDYKTVTAGTAGSFVIGQATPVLTVTNSPVTYNGSAQAATVSAGSVTGTASNVMYNGSSTVPTTVGTYAITANFTSTNPNYTNLTGASAGNFVIAQATAIVTTLPTASAITYGQMLSASTLTGGSATPSAGSFQWVTPNAVPLAGTQSESVIFVPTDTVDYSSSAPSTINVTVNPASFIVTVSSDDSGTASHCTPQTTPGTGTDTSCSLRDALLEAAATGGGNITFDSTKFGAATTITLGNGTLNVPSATTVTGTTTGSGVSLANLVTVDGNGASTVFTVSSGVTGASIANLIVQHGNNAGIQNAGVLTLTGDSIISNTATGSGGGINNNSGTLTLSSSTISGNTAGGSGGGISNSGTLTLSDDTLTGNSSSGSGGGIYNSASLAVSDSTLSGNTAATASGGGGIDNVGSGSVTLANSILSGNSSNSAADDFDGATYTNNLGNVVGVVNGGPVNANAITLAPLASYGGPTKTLIPLPNSPAICAGLAAGIPTGLTSDQRGLPNTNAGYPGYSKCVDAGAVQTNYALSFSTEPTSASVNTNFAAGVTLTESGSSFQPSVTIPLTLTGSGTLSGGSAATSGGVASYTLQVNAAGSGDTLTANLLLNGAVTPAVAISATSSTFNVGLTTPTVGLSLSSASVTYGTLVTFTATVPSPATGSVKFYNNGSTLLGTGTVSGGTATFSSSTLAAGSYSITAAYSGDSNYNSATSTAQSLTVNQATPTVTWATPAAITYGTALSATQLDVSASFNSNSVPGTYAYNPASGAVLGAGSQTLKVTFTPTDTTDYTTATGQVTLTVNHAALTVTANNASRTYGAANPAFTASYTGFVNGDTQSVLSGSPSLTTTATASSPAGSYTITAAAGTLSATNYSFTFVNGTLTVNPAALTVTANNANRVYGTANPTFAGSVTGAVNGDSFTESFSTAATINSNAGTYAIVPSATGTDLADYSVTVQNGTLTITQAGTTTSLGVSSGSITPGQNVTLTATVLSATTGTPTGSVNLYDGTSLLDTAPLSGGTASFSTTTLSAGTTHQLTAVYSGDVNFATSSTSSSTPIIVASLDFTVTASAPTSQTVTAGSAAAYQMVVAPLYGTYAASVTFAATGLPAGATATFSPTSIAANGGQQTVTMTVQTAATSALRQAVPRSPASRALQPFALAFLLLLGIGGMRRHGTNLRRVFYVLLLLIGGATTVLTGCGGHTNSTTQTPETYTITVTATSGSLQHSTAFSLTVQ